MRTTDFMDKQMTMGLSRSHSDDDFSADNSSSLYNSTSLMDHYDLARASRRRVGDSDAGLISSIDGKLKEHIDNVLYAVEGISARLSQLETRTRRLESSIDDLKESVEHNQGRADGKMRELENILREVQGGVLDLRDKQEIAEAQVQLAKLQTLKNNRGSENQNNSMQTTMVPETLSSTHQQTPKPLSNHVACSQQLSVPTSLPYQEPQPLPAATAPQLPAQMLPNLYYSTPQHDTYYSPPTQAPEIMHLQYHMHSPQHLPTQSSAQHLPPQPLVQHQPYGSSHEPLQTSQLQKLPQLHPPVSAFNQAYHPASHHPEENSYMAPQTYPPSVYKPSQLPRASQTQQPYVGSSQQMHDQTSSGSFYEFAPPYSQSPEYSNFGNIYPNSGSPSNYRSSTMKSSQISESASASTGVSNHSRLPTAKLLPQALPTARILPEALPTANSVDGGSSSGGTGNKVPVDDVVEKVVAMGFRRDLVRATVRKLTENGQSVDLNSVLDKVMNDGEGQAQTGRFG